MMVILSGCKSRQTVISFYIPGSEGYEVTLEWGDQEEVKSRTDTTGRVEFKIENATSGYAYLVFGRGSRKMIFMEAGKDLDVIFSRKPQAGHSRYSFEGEGAPENQYLDENLGQKPLFIDKKITENELMQLLDERALKVENELSLLPYSPEFIRLEKERQRYTVLGRFAAYCNYTDWSPAIYPYLKERLKEVPQLLKTDGYKGFLLNVLFMIGFEADPECSPYRMAKGQMDYIVGNMKDTTVADFLMGTVISGYMDKKGVDSITTLMEIFTRKVHSARLRKSIEEKYTTWERVAKGKSIPEFTFLDINGSEVALSGFKGKYVYIDCWATWCGPCKQQLPALKILEHKYAGKDIVFVSISSDKDRQKWKDMVVKDKLKGVQLIEKLSTASEFSERFVITGIPRFILLDKEGRVYDANAPRPSDPAAVKLLDSVLSRK